MRECFVGLGGNLEGSRAVLERAVREMGLIEGVFDLICSKFYLTSPVSSEALDPFVNCVCRFRCSLSLATLWEKLQELENFLGKMPKPRNAPRLIDIDLLFFGDVIHYSGNLVVPHPRWHERLFVLAPLAEVADTIPLGINTKDILKKFSNPHGEVVCLI